MMTIDLAESPKKFLPKAKSLGASLWKSLGLLLLAITLANLIGALATYLLKLLMPDVPLYVGLITGALALVVILRYIAQRFEWIMPWYYLLPAIIFLITFTLFPVILTIVLAFTNYAGIRNGELNVSSETKIAAISGATLTLDSPQTLSCNALLSLSELDSNSRGEKGLSGCENVKARIYASGRFETSGLSLEGTSLTLAAPPPAGREVEWVELFIPDFGFAQPGKVVSGVGVLGANRAPPPAPPKLDSLTLGPQPCQHRAHHLKTRGQQPHPQ
ncbi:MAG: hypothetical protein R2865_17055 [Deinococcales bacterium]